MAAGSSSVVSHPAGRRRFLLVVDSDIKKLFYTATLLQRFQYSIWTAQSAEVALEMASVAVPALIVTAQFLEDMTGLELIQQLKRIERIRAVPLVVLTQKTDPADERDCLFAGALTCLSMPVQLEDLYRVVQVAIEPMPRMNLRINTSLSVTVNDRTVECLEGECASVLSEHGLYVRTLDPYPLNAKLPVEIRLEGKSIAADTVVIYSHQAGDDPQDEPGMGLQFTEISREDQKRIRNFIRDEITRDIDVR
jgi:CheY-like chemotaxis protein